MMKTSNQNLHRNDKPKKKFLKKLKSFLKGLFYSRNSARYVRLEGDLKTFAEELKTKEVLFGAAEWKTQALRLSAEAEQKLREWNIDEGWKLLHAAKRLEACGNPQTQRAIALELYEEISKLDDWRKNAIHKILDVNNNGVIQNLNSIDLNYALKIRDEFYHKLYYINRLARTQYGLMFGLLFAWIIFLFVYIRFNGIILTPEYHMEVMSCKNLLGVLLFGLLGSTTSSIFHFRNSQSSSLVPEIVSNIWVTLSRIFVGAGFSVFIFILLNSSFIKAIDIFSFTLNSCYEFFTIAFISGFSERLALNSIQKIIGKKE